MTPSWDRDSIRRAARQLADHPQDQGWRELYRLFARELEDETSPLSQILADHFASRPYGGAAHAFTLLGIALKQQARDRFEDLTGPAVAHRRTLLNDILTDGREQIGAIMTLRQNSFTCARRFLIPQVLLAGFFHTTGTRARLLDVGTGLGILPRQLNCRTAYEAFAADLAWPTGPAPYADIPLEARLGIDRPPFPDLDWVRSCYGDSDYYRRIYDELLWSMSLPQVRDAAVTLHELDIQDLERLAQYVTDNQINAIHCSYVLYELTEHAQAQVIATLATAMASPGLMIVTEPRPELAYHGCKITLHLTTGPAIGLATVPADEPPGRTVEGLAGRSAAIDFAVVTDRHFIGKVEPAGGYQDFVNRYVPALAAG